MKKVFFLIKCMQQMIFLVLALGALILTTLSVHAQPSSSEKAPLKDLANTLEVSYQVVSNLQNDDCQAIFNGPCFAGKLSFSLSDNQVFDNFSLFFSHIAPIKWDSHKTLDIQHFNGDLHKIEFLGNEFATGDTITIGFKAAFWHASHSDIMPNYFVVSQSVGPFIVDSTRAKVDSNTGLEQAGQLIPYQLPEQYRRNKDDNLPLADAAWLFNHYQQWQGDASDKYEVTGSETARIIPNIKFTDWSENTYLDVSAGLKIKWHGGDTNKAIAALFADADISISDSGVPVDIQAKSALAAESYQIQVEPDGIRILAANKTGADYALVSLYQILKTQGKRLPLGSADDAPRYGFRGVHVDLSRNFLGKEVILHLIQQMFVLKLNKLHLHLADDEGWRLDIPTIPELTEVGAWRCFEPEENNCLLPQLGSGPFRDSPTNGFLTVEDYLQILRFAHERHIEVIPSFDLPGHARAAVKAMEARYRKYKALEDSEKAEQYLLTDFQDDTQYSSVQFYCDNTVNPCMESTYRFIDDVISSVKAMHVNAQVPLSTYHIGADETAGAWLNSPVCQELIASHEDLKDVSDLKPMFLNRVIEIIEKHDLKAAGWSDGMHKILEVEAGQGHQVNVWDTLFWDAHEKAQEFTEKGWSTVLSHPDVLYFDFPYSNNPNEPGYYWASKNTDEFKIFQFMPENPGANALQWQDRFGHPYKARVKINEPFAFTGMQTQIWTESVRNVETFQYLMYPRLQVFAERAWHKANWEFELENGEYQFGQNRELLLRQIADWQLFETALMRYLQSGSLQDANLRIPPPGVLFRDNLLWVNTPWSGLQVQCRTGNNPWVVISSTTDVFSDAGQITCRSSFEINNIKKFSREVSVTIGTVVL